jgi:hypothetical protein
VAISNQTKTRTSTASLIEAEAEDWDDTPVHFNRINNKGAITLTQRGVFRMAALGWSVKDICKLHGVNPDEIYETFGEPVKSGKYGTAHRLKKRLMQLVFETEKPDPSLVKFALKNFAGLCEDGKDFDTDEGIKPNALSVNLHVSHNKADFE